MFDVKRLRWERGELYGLLLVYWDLAGLRHVDGAFSVGTFNLTSLQARSGRAKDLATVTAATEINWRAELDELCQRTITAEQTGNPIRILRDVQRTDQAATTITIDGVPLLRSLPQIIFGDGGTGKTTIALHLAGHLERLGVSVLYLDYEMDESEQRAQLEKIFGTDMPELKYRRCERPLAIEVDGIEQQVRDCGIDFVFVDSVVPACDGPVIDADVAQRYFQALRRLRVGSCSLAHIAKGENNDQKPFGSAFWSNLARATWYAERADSPGADDEIAVGLYCRKANLWRPGLALGYRLEFSGDRITVTPSNVTNNAQLAEKLPLWARMKTALTRGPRTLSALAEELGANVDTLDRTVRRKNLLFTRTLSGDGIARIALVERRAS